MVQIGIDDEALCRQLTIIFGVACGIERNEIVGHDTSSAIYGAPQFACGELQRVGEVYAVGVCQFAAIVAVDDVLAITLLVTFGIGLLNTSPRGCVVARYGEAYHRAVGQIHRLLYKPLAKGTASDYEPAVLVLYGTRQDFGCRCGILINKDYEFSLLETAAAIADEYLRRNIASTGIDDGVASGDELAGDGCRNIQQSATVLLQVDDEFGHPLTL